MENPVRTMSKVFEKQFIHGTQGIYNSSVLVHLCHNSLAISEIINNSMLTCKIQSARGQKVE